MAILGGLRVFVYIYVFGEVFLGSFPFFWGALVKKIRFFGGLSVFLGNNIFKNESITSFEGYKFRTIGSNTRSYLYIIGSNTRSYISWDLNFLYLKK